jgi:glycine cleavage system regulatory protein
VITPSAQGIGRADTNRTYSAGGASWSNPNQWYFENAPATTAGKAQARFDPNLFAQSGAGSASNEIAGDGTLTKGGAGEVLLYGGVPLVVTMDGPFQSGDGRTPTTQPTPGFTTHSGTMSLPQAAQSGGALISSTALAQATTRPAGGSAGNANQGATQPLDTSVPKEVAERLVREANAANAASARRVIREGVMEFEVDSFDSAFNQIATIVGEEGGFISAADSDKLPNGEVRGTITVRVPPDRLDLLVLKLRALGELKSQKLGSRDIGKEYTDLESDLRASRAMETRLLDIIAKAPGKVNELLEAENKLGEVRTHIEKIMGTLNYYNNLISMATLTVNVAEKDIRTPASADIREEINAGVETEDVETARTAALKAIDDAKGRIVESTLQKLEAGQFAAKIVAEVSPDAAGPIVDRLKQLGRLARYDVQKKQVIENAKLNATVQAQPPVRLETVPTRIIISMYNLANVAPRLTTNLNLAGDDVEAVYRAILKRITDAGGRIVSSNLNKQDAAQVSGTIQYELKSADADAVLNDVRQQALVLRMTVTENPDTANVTTAKQAFTAQIIPTSQLTPKLVSNLNLAAQDVETVYNAVLKRINDSAGARVITSNLNRQDASRISGTIQFEVKSPDADAVLNDIRNQGLVLSLNVTENADGVNVTTTKRGFTATISPIAQLTPKLTTNLSIAAQDVEATYNAILKAVQESDGARVVSSNLNRQDAMQAVGALQIEAKSADAATLLSKIRQNVQVLQMNVIESPAGSNVTAEKQAFTVQVIPTSQVNPRETRVLGIQTSNVEGAVQVVNAAVSGAGGRIIESSMSQDRGGNSVARMVVEVPLDKADNVSDSIRKQGTVRASESSKNTQVPEGPLARARLNLTIATGETIVPTEGGFGNSIREGLSTSIKGLLWSLQLIVIGLCLIGPWVLMVWGGWRIARKRKTAKAQP